jgi:hypothetical protein
MIGNLIEGNKQDQRVKQIEYVVYYRNKVDNEVIENELEERFKEELGYFKDFFDAVLMSKCFEKIK